MIGDMNRLGLRSEMMNNAWTGGQYSIFRVLLAAGFLVHLAMLSPEVRQELSSGGFSPHTPDAPVVILTLLAAGVLLSGLLALGWHDRPAATGLCFIWIWLMGPDLLVLSLLLVHTLVPPAPYGSWAARGRPDPGGGWRMPGRVYALAWVLLSAAYLYRGTTHLLDPAWHSGKPVLFLELAFVPLVLIPSWRPWVWGLLLLVQVAILPLASATAPAFGLLMLHLFAGDPGWIPPQRGRTEVLFYDGHCGLCQRSVRLILAEDLTGTAFCFAPLQGETFQSLLSEKERKALPLSLVVRTEQGTLLTRSAGVLHILRRLGGVWRLLAGLLGVLPVILRDRLYDGVARIRHHLFARPAELCPLLPPQFRGRFDP
jgi:predicted DCC family thiol-disulfide oxidoreductase YuxK